MTVYTDDREDIIVNTSSVVTYVECIGIYWNIDKCLYVQEYTRIPYDVKLKARDLKEIQCTFNAFNYFQLLKV